MQINDTISIVAASGRNSVSNTMLVAAAMGEIIAATDKAVKVKAETLNGKEIEAWFPRKALTAVGSTAVVGSNSHHNTVKLAPWFAPTGWTARFVELATWVR